jgi:pyruvate dehydrogenase E2 component (dihydrolipoamide acetyltransferase)
MAHPILMPKPGQMTEECTLVAWHKREGDPVRKGDLLFEIETDKSNMDVEAFDDGVLLKRVVDEGQTVPVNSVCAYVGEPGEVVPESALAPGTTQSPPMGAVAGTDARMGQPLAGQAGRLPISPRARRLAETVGLDPRVIAGTGPGGRILERDVRAASVSLGRSVALSHAPGSDQEAAGERVRISPRASRLAAAAGIDPRTISGTGTDGRVTERDIRTAIETSARRAQTPGAAAAARLLATSAPGPGVGEDEGLPQPLSRVRRIIADRLTLSATTVPQFTLTVAVDMTALVTLRNELKASGAAPSVTDFIGWATAQALVEFPDVNSRTDGVSVWRRSRVHLGIAVSLPAGLVVPVIRDADRLSVSELHVRAGALVEAARRGTLSPDDMSGGTFTISNLGMLGVDEFGAIINPGEAAILAVASIVPTPVAVGDAIGIRQVMKLTLTSDHRLVDGELAARFLNSVRLRLQDAAAMRDAVHDGQDLS